MTHQPHFFIDKDKHSLDDLKSAYLFSCKKNRSRKSLLVDNVFHEKLFVKLYSSNAKKLAVPEASLNLKKIVLKIFNGDIIEFKN